MERLIDGTQIDTDGAMMNLLEFFFGDIERTIAICVTMTAIVVAFCYWLPS